MFRLRALLRPVVHKLPPPGLRRAPPAPPSRCLGTHGRNEPREPLNSPKRAKEFIYRLQPKERTCLLKELQSFESIAIAQGKEVKREIPEVFTVGLQVRSEDPPSLPPPIGVSQVIHMLLGG